MKLIINLPNDWEELIREMSDSEIVGWLYAVCRNGKPLSEVKVTIGFSGSEIMGDPGTLQIINIE